MAHVLKDRLIRNFKLAKVTIGTDCSGAEAPIWALREIQRALKTHCGIKFDTHQAFAADIQEHSRRFIEMNSDCPVIYGDLTTRLPPTLAGFCMKNHRVIHCPGELDIYCAGFPCKDFSFLNGSRACLSGPNAKVFHGVCNYIKYKQPSVYILENVDGITRKDKNGRSPLNDVMA